MSPADPSISLDEVMPDSVGRAHSSHVTQSLHAQGRAYELVHSAAGYAVLREPAVVPVGEGVLEVVVDGRPWRTKVRITECPAPESDRAMVRFTRL